MPVSMQTKPQPTPKYATAWGIACGAGAALFWALGFVAARQGVTSGLSPLVIALHGMGGDENSMFDSYGGVLKREAERVGFVVACPKGRDSASMYRGSAEQDVMDVLAEVRRDYKIDPNRIYLMGHSMGAYGTWSVAPIPTTHAWSSAWFR